MHLVINYNTNQGLFIKKYDSINLLICYLLLRLPIHTTIEYGLHISAIHPSMIDIPFVLFFACNAFPYLIKSIRLNSLLYILGIVFLIMLSMLPAQDTSVHWALIGEIVRYCLLLYLAGLAIKNHEDLLNSLYITSWILVGLSLLNIMVFSFHTAAGIQYDQNYGYELIPAIMIILLRMIDDFKMRDFILFVIAVILVFASGSRGPILSLLIGLLVANIYFISIAANNYKHLLFLLLQFIALIIIYINHNKLLLAAVNIFEKNGLPLRSLLLIQENNISQDTARGNLVSFALNYITSHPFVGTGLVNDRYLIYQNVIVNNQQTIYGSYCHNIFLEWLVQFGLVLGVIIGIVFIYAVMKTYLKTDNMFIRKLIIVFGTYGVSPLLVSRSYLGERWFYFFIALLFNAAFWRLSNGQKNKNKSGNNHE